MKLACECRWLGECPWRAGEDRVDGSGRKLYRAPTDAELDRFERGLALGNLTGAVEPGDLVSADRAGRMRLEGIPVDRAARLHALSTSEAMCGRRCKAESFVWRMRHASPPPE